MAAGLSLLLSALAAVAWVMSYATASDWKLVGVAHSSDLVRVEAEANRASFVTVDGWSKSPNHGFWDGLWIMSRSGAMTVLAQAVDYEGTLQRLWSVPPQLSVSTTSRTDPDITTFAAVPTISPRNLLGFGWQVDSKAVPAGAGPINARARMITLPYWFIILIGLAAPVLRLRARHRRRRDTGLTMSP